jgi:hypothetical protein
VRDSSCDAWANIRDLATKPPQWFEEKSTHEIAIPLKRTTDADPPNSVCVRIGDNTICHFL